MHTTQRGVAAWTGMLLLLVLAGRSHAGPTCTPSGGGTFKCDVTCTGVCVVPATHADCDDDNVDDEIDGYCTICGTAGDDDITGTDGADVVCAKGGADIIDTGAGNDIIDAGGGDDQIDSGAGSDWIFAGEGDDDVDAGDGDDFVDGRGGADVIHGGAGSDHLLGGPGDDRLESEEPGYPAVSVALPDDFSPTVSGGEFELSTFVTDCSASESESRCGSTWSGPGCTHSSYPGQFLIHDDASGDFLMASGSGAGTPTVAYTAERPGSYTISIEFSRPADCDSGGDISLWAVGVGLATIAADDTDRSRTLSATVELEAGEPTGFMYFGSSNDGAMAVLEYSVEAAAGAVANPENLIGSRLCGGPGDDFLFASGRGHQCLQGAETDRGSSEQDECFFAYAGSLPAADSDVGTAANCALVKGDVDSGRSPSCCGE